MLGFLLHSADGSLASPSSATNLGPHYAVRELENNYTLPTYNISAPNCSTDGIFWGEEGFLNIKCEYEVVNNIILYNSGDIRTALSNFTSCSEVTHYPDHVINHVRSSENAGGNRKYIVTIVVNPVDEIQFCLRTDLLYNTSLPGVTSSMKYQKQQIKIAFNYTADFQMNITSQLFDGLNNRTNDLETTNFQVKACRCSEDVDASCLGDNKDSDDSGNDDNSLNDEKCAVHDRATCMSNGLGSCFCKWEGSCLYKWECNSNSLDYEEICAMFGDSENCNGVGCFCKWDGRCLYHRGCNSNSLDSDDLDDSVTNVLTIDDPLYVCIDSETSDIVVSEITQFTLKKGVNDGYNAITDGTLDYNTIVRKWKTSGVQVGTRPQASLFENDDDIIIGGTAVLRSGSTRYLARFTQEVDNGAGTSGNFEMQVEVIKANSAANIAATNIFLTLYGKMIGIIVTTFIFF